MAEIYGFAIQVEGNAVKSLTAIDQSLNHLNNNAGKAGESIAGGFIKANVAMQAFNAAVSGAKATYNLGVQTEQTRVAFDTMLVSAEKGGQMFQSLKKWADVTPFDNDTAYQAGRMLLNYGIAAQDVLPYMNMLGDASGGVKERFDRMAYAFGQIKSAGKLQGQDLRQLIDAGFNPLQEISAKTGESMTSLKAKMEKGEITFQKVVQAFQMATGEGGRFNGMMEKQSQTVGGLFSTLEGTAQTAAYGIFQAFSPTLKNIFKDAISVTTAFSEWVTPKQSDLLSRSKVEMNSMFEMLQNSNLPLDKRREIIANLNSNYKDYLKNIVTEKDTYKDLEKNQQASNKAMIQRIQLAAQQELIEKELKKVSEAETVRWKMQDLFEQAKQGDVNTWEQAKAFGKEYGIALLNPLNIAKAAKVYSNPVEYFRMALAQSIVESNKAQSEFGKFQQRMGKNFTTDFGNTNIAGIDPSKAFKENASATSDLGKPGGGLGEAKVINISIDKMMQVNASSYTGGDMTSDAVKTVEEMTRMIKNISYGQGLM